MAINAWGLTTVARYKSYAGITGVASDARIEVLINIISDWIEHYCDRRFIETAYTDEIYDGTGSDKLLLRQYPVSERAGLTLEERDTDLNENQWSSVDTNLYHIDWNAGIVELVGYRFKEVVRKYAVTYTAGYAFDNVTPGVTLESLGIGDLEYACWVLVDNLFSGAGSSTGIQSESIGNYSVSFGANFLSTLPPEIKLILDKYKRPHSM